MRHKDKNGNWSKRTRIYAHPLLGKRFHHIYLGYGKITRMWRQHDYMKHVEPHDDISTIIEYTTDRGMRFVTYYWQLAPDMVDDEGKLVKNSKLWEGFDGHAPSGVLGLLAKKLRIEAKK